MYFQKCVSNSIENPSDLINTCILYYSSAAECRGDIGGPYMSELEHVHQFVALGLALKTDNCKERSPDHFSIFLNLLHPSISDWVNATMYMVENGLMDEQAEEDNGDGNDDDAVVVGAAADNDEEEENEPEADENNDPEALQDEDPDQAEDNEEGNVDENEENDQDLGE